MTDVNAKVRDKSTRSHRLKVENDTKNRPCELDISKELFLSFMPVLSNGFSFLAGTRKSPTIVYCDISDSTTSHIEELSETYGKVCDEVPEEDDFDSLLRMCQEGLGR